MKTKLNVALRGHLRKLASDKVVNIPTEVHLRTSRMRCEKMILNCIKAQFPPKEMLVLAKHEVARKSWWYELLIIRGDMAAADEPQQHFERWELPHETDAQKEKLPLTPVVTYGSKKVRIEHPAEIQIMRDYWEAKSAHETALEEKTKAFDLLIKHATYLEQVEAVWSEAKAVRRHIAQLPAVEIGPLQDQVKAILDVKTIT